MNLVFRVWGLGFRKTNFFVGFAVTFLFLKMVI